MNQGEKLEDLDEYTTLLEFTPEKSGYYKLYTTGLNTGTLRLYKDKDYTKIVKITLRWQKKMQKTVKMSP